MKLLLKVILAAACLVSSTAFCQSEAYTNFFGSIAIGNHTHYFNLSPGLGSTSYYRVDTDGYTHDGNSQLEIFGSEHHPLKSHHIISIKRTAGNKTLPLINGYFENTYENNSSSNSESVKIKTVLGNTCEGLNKDQIDISNLSFNQNTGEIYSVNISFSKSCNNSLIAKGSLQIIKSAKVLCEEKLTVSNKQIVNLSSQLNKYINANATLNRRLTSNKNFVNRAVSAIRTAKNNCKNATCTNKLDAAIRDLVVNYQ